ncbi:bifunctional enoyl-CoA hydratase/phosphate acetyltransferase [Azorhizobium oxalatiphilum]|uniref:Bifunctional enoyl-CoA hydratase/phosphate acetyltransferase n=1 Tax=Azorhizobium oxalatiphilum TaxID=980631 RepID=A0A917BWS2_9HYPH|nr:bifunctional enoyl-CoA hydratase/phosphate acetyltransferase [Azorhizobium oxalatiphilum]GGF60991.1 bifunctional enoyl-CoA hydratase/phosphate acetyltransferase [Azorhizobium oxalatiphilum]
MTSNVLQNKTFEELALGDAASVTRTVGDDDIKLFAAVSGDVNPAHLDPAYAATDIFGHVIVHGMWTGALISSVLGTELPGPGTIYLEQSLRFRRPVSPGDTITATVTVREKREDKKIVILETLCINQSGVEVLAGSATVIAPTEKLRLPRMAVPEVSVRPQGRYERYIAEARALPATVVGVVHPCSAEAIQAAIEARDEGMIEPILIGPERRIQEAAEKAGVSLAGLRIEDVEHSHAAAALGVELATSGKIEALMKGSLHTDELLGAVVAKGSGLRTDRRISHVYALDVPNYPKSLMVTDAAINIAPTLAQKRDICQNAIDLLHRLGTPEPLVAVLAAVETVNADMPATLDAAALSMMARRGQITGAKVDGPLAFDNAISFAAARIKEIVSPVAGQADILLVPNLEAGNLLAKQMIYLAGADAAGLVLGARVPIILTSRADSLKVRLASVALAKLSIAGGQKMAVPA